MICNLRSRPPPVITYLQVKIITLLEVLAGTKANTVINFEIMCLRLDATVLHWLMGMPSSLFTYIHTVHEGVISQQCHVCCKTRKENIHFAGGACSHYSQHC